jgi:TonB family protein
VGLTGLSREVTQPARWKAFLAGLGIDIFCVLLLIGLIPRFATVIERQTIAGRYSVTLIAPVVAPGVKHSPPRSLMVPSQSVVLKASSSARTQQARSIETPKPESPEPELPRIASSPLPVPAVRTNGFAAEKSQMATLLRPPREVQTGGFGDPNGVPSQTGFKRDTIMVATVGSFELPAGAGTGNGTAGTRGVSGSIRSTGFGDGIAPQAARGRGNGGVAASGFGEVVAQAGSARQRVEKMPELQPVEIVYKPRPEYTTEARRRRVQGEVLLEVVFTASGSLHINRVVKGLGYGLDDTALAAAQRIQFRPARKDGQPYDCAALVHMVFELAD